MLKQFSKELGHLHKIRRPLVFKVYSNLNVHLATPLDSYSWHSEPLFTAEQPREMAFCLSGKEQSLYSNMGV